MPSHRLKRLNARSATAPAHTEFPGRLMETRQRRFRQCQLPCVGCQPLRNKKFWRARYHQYLRGILRTVCIAFMQLGCGRSFVESSHSPDFAIREPADWYNAAKDWGSMIHRQCHSTKSATVFNGLLRTSPTLAEDTACLYPQRPRCQSRHRTTSIQC